METPDTGRTVRTRRNRTPFVGLIAVVAVLFVVPGAAAETHVVEIRANVDGAAWDFVPAELDIAVGDSVRWVQMTEVGHTATSTDDLSAPSPNGVFDHSFPGDPDAAAATFTFTFDEAGTYPFYCKPHSSFMQGTITVGSAGGAGGDGGADGDESGDSPAVSALAGALVLVGVLLVARRRRSV